MLLRLVVILGVGLLGRAGTLPLGRRIAARHALQIPALLSYAVAGTVAALTREALAAGAGVSGWPLWLAFGATWGILAGLLLPFAKRLEPGPDRAVSSEFGP